MDRTYYARCDLTNPIINLENYSILLLDLYLQNPFNNNPQILELRALKNRGLFTITNTESIYSQGTNYSTGLKQLFERAKVPKGSCIVKNDKFIPACVEYFNKVLTSNSEEQVDYCLGGGEDLSSYSQITQMLTLLLQLNTKGGLIMEITELKYRFHEFIIVYVAQMFNTLHIFKAIDSRQVYLYFNGLKSVDAGKIQSLLGVLLPNTRKKKKFEYPDLELPELLQNKLPKILINFQNLLYNSVGELKVTMNVPDDTEIPSILQLDENTGQFDGVMSNNVTYYTIKTLASNNIFSFPYKRFHSFNDNDRNHPNKLFERLITYQGSIRKTKNFPQSLIKFTKPVDFRLRGDLNLGGPSAFYIDKKESDYDIDKLTDYFTEPVRMRASVKGFGMSPEEFWIKNADWCVASLRSSNTEVTTNNLREFIYKTIKEATQFKATLSTVVYDYISVVLKNHKLRVLDPCSGWGDRLLGALASINVASYTGNDPNKELQSGYQEMIEVFREKKIHNKYTMMVGRAENLSINDKFDLVFTSPPYFDYEIYQDSPDQSTHNRTLDQWKESFLYPMLEKSLRLLVSKGYMIIHITDHKDLKICEDMYDYMDTLDCTFMGCMIASAKSNIPMWVWMKH